MTLLHRLASVVTWIFRRKRSEQALDDELRAFVEMSAADKVRDGYSPAEARRLAIIELGGVEQTRERVRTYRHGGGLDDIGRDVRYALRTFARNPGFTVIVVLTLALGIGANTAIFSLIDALMLRTLPVPNPRELLQVAFRPATPADTPGVTFSYAMVRAFDEQRDIFSGVAGFSASSFDVGAPGSISHVPGAMVTGAYYETLGLTPALGRLLSRADDEAGAPLVAVLSYGYWERVFARRPDVLGQILTIKGLPVAIVGVSPPGFVGANVGSVADITMAAATLAQVNPSDAPLLGKGNFWMRTLARPAAGVQVEQATARLNAVWPQIADSVIAPHWPAFQRKGLAAASFQLNDGGTGWTFLRAMYRKPLIVLMAVVGLVLLIACANVASLLLARASARQREIAVRLAIGAGRGRIVRQLLIESTLLSLIGAAFGVGLAWVSGQFLVALISSGPFDAVFDLTPNWRVLGFTSAIAIATGLLFGMAPALQTTANGTAAALKSGRMGGSLSRVLPTLVSAQVALSLVLLAGAGLFVRTLHNLQSLDPGFNATGVLVAELERGPAVPAALLDEVQRLPGVLSATVSTHTPLNGSVWSEPAVPAGQAVPERDNAYFIGAGPDFFTTMQIPLVSGRAFTARDAGDGPTVAIVNEVFAQQHFKNQNPVGQHLAAKVNGARRDLEIVGLVRNTHAAGLRVAPPATVYVAYAQLSGRCADVRVGARDGCARSGLVRVPANAPNAVEWPGRSPGAVSPGAGDHHPGADDGDARRRIRTAGADARLRRALRPAGLRRRATDQGNRHSHGPRRPGGAGRRAGARSRHAARADRDRTRPAGRVSRISMGEVDAVRSDAGRPRHARRGNPAPCGRRATCGLHPGTPCRSSRPAGGAAARVDAAPETNEAASLVTASPMWQRDASTESPARRDAASSAHHPPRSIVRPVW